MRPLQSMTTTVACRAQPICSLMAMIGHRCLDVGAEISYTGGHRSLSYLRESFDPAGRRSLTNRCRFKGLEVCQSSTLAIDNAHRRIHVRQGHELEGVGRGSRCLKGSGEWSGICSSMNAGQSELHVHANLEKATDDAGLRIRWVVVEPRVVDRIERRAPVEQVLYSR